MFDQAFIEATREAQGDEAANQLIAANMSEEHRGRMQRVATDQTLAAKYPRVLNGVKTNVLQIPTLPSDEAMEQYLAQQEKVLTDLGVPDPTKPVVNDGRFAPPGDALTIRHSKKAVVSLADGHVVAVLPGYATNQLYYQPDL